MVDIDPDPFHKKNKQTRYIASLTGEQLTKEKSLGSAHKRLFNA